MYVRKTDRTSHNRSAEPLLRAEPSAHPDLCRVAGCDRSPWCRGVCKSHYNQMQPGRPWAHKAVLVLAPVKGYTADEHAPTVDELRAEISALTDERQALTTERAALLLRAETAEQELLATQAHALTVEEQVRGAREQTEEIRESFNNVRAHLANIDAVLNSSGVPLVVGDAMPGDRLARVCWLADRVRVLDLRPSVEASHGI